MLLLCFKNNRVAADYQSCKCSLWSVEHRLNFDSNYLRRRCQEVARSPSCFHKPEAKVSMQNLALRAAFLQVCCLGSLLYVTHQLHKNCGMLLFLFPFFVLFLRCAALHLLNGVQQRTASE